MKLYHFLDENYGLKAIEFRKLKIARIMGLNDPFELLGVNLKNRNLRRAMNHTKQKFADRYGLICFSRDWKNPVQWSHCANHHKGLCLEFEVDKGEEGRETVKKVTYSDDRLQVHNGIDDHHAFMVKILTTKCSHWDYEQEYRLFLELNPEDQQGELYFKSFDDQLKLTAVIVGLSSKVKRQEVSTALGGISDGIESFKARAGFTKFEVIKNANKKMWT